MTERSKDGEPDEPEAPKEESSGVSPRTKEVLESFGPQLILEQISRDMPYFLKLLAMNRPELEAEIAELEKTTRDYRSATGNELDWWPPHYKRAAAERVEKLRLANEVLKKYDAPETAAMRRYFRDKKETN